MKHSRQYAQRALAFWRKKLNEANEQEEGKKLSSGGALKKDELEERAKGFAKWMVDMAKKGMFDHDDNGKKTVEEIKETLQINSSLKKWNEVAKQLGYATSMGEWYVGTFKKAVYGNENTTDEEAEKFVKNLLKSTDYLNVFCAYVYKYLKPHTGEKSISGIIAALGKEVDIKDLDKKGDDSTVDEEEDEFGDDIDENDLGVHA